MSNFFEKLQRRNVIKAAISYAVIGWAILQVPFFYPLKDETHEDFTITSPKDRERIFGQDDHVRMYGKDYPDRIRKAGFKVTEDEFVHTLNRDEIHRHALPENEVIHYCVK